MLSRTFFPVLLLGVFLSGCSGEKSTGPGEEETVAVTTTVDRDPVSPGQTVTVTVRATPTGSARVRWITVIVTGLVEKRDSTSFDADGPQELKTTFRVPGQPSSGSVTITGSA